VQPVYRYMQRNGRCSAVMVVGMMHLPGVKRNLCEVYGYTQAQGQLSADSENTKCYSSSAVLLSSVRVATIHNNGSACLVDNPR
jgi:hypothetical protein